MNWLAKFVGWLVSPLGTSLLLAALALAMAWAGRSRLAGRLGALAVAWVWVFSTPVVDSLLRSTLEADYPLRSMHALPTAPAAVVLGGAIATPSPDRPYPGLTDSSDRIWHAARLYRAGKAPLLLLSGGSDLQTQLISEAAAMRLLLMELGVPDDVLLLEPRSRTTSQNALFSAELLRQRGISQVLLVTSAVHMRRATAEFEAQGLRVVPVAIDQTEPARWDDFGAWVPDAGALNSTASTIKEWIGRVALSVRR
jgi:uncharacterized SAM-binding protein YcdF (DUF218 family)